MIVELTVAGRSDRGLVREGNEDFLHLDEENHVYAVCDGMGGHQAGEVASLTASQVIRTLFNQLKTDLANDDRLMLPTALPHSGEILVKAIRMANRSIYQKAATDPNMAGMGTTVVAVAFEDDLMSVAHVGDSRAYRLEKRGIVPLTRDHSWVSEIKEQQNISDEELLSMVGRNVITRALGVRDTVEVDYQSIRVKPGDIYILCSDGLCGFADDDEIFSVAHAARDDMDKLVIRLIQMANDRGGSDNVTIIAVHVNNVHTTDTNEIRAFTVTAETGQAAQAEDEWLMRLAEFKQQEPPPVEKKKEINKWVLVLIFALFVLAAVAVVFMLGSK